MKNQHTPGVKLYNWNILQDAFKKMNLPLDNDIKNLIVQGDTEMINELLKDVHERDQSVRKSRSSLQSEDSKIIQKPPSRPTSKLPNTQYDSQSDESKEHNQKDFTQPIEPIDTKTLEEFLLNGLSKHLSLKHSQAAQLLQNGNKYLAHLVVKGVKGEFEQIINWLSEIYANLDKVYQFFEQDNINVHLFLSCLKPGLLSKEQEVTLWSLRIMGRVFYELAEMEMHQVGYEWFCTNINASFMCLQRHPYLVSQLCELFGQVSRYNVTDFFTVQFKKELADKCVDMLNTLFEGLYSQKTLKDELLSCGVIQYWASLCIKQGDLVSLKYLSQYWMYYPIQFEEDQNLPNQYLFMMKKASRDQSKVLRYFSLNYLFRILEKLANDRNPYAAVLYKKLTFSLIENYDDVEMREFIINNFMYLIQRFSSIPIDILIEPLVKQIIMNDTLVNFPDMKLFKFIVGHPKMRVRLAIILLDLLAKIYLNNPIYSSLAFNPIQILLARFAESQLLREYAFKLAKISLALHYNSLKSRKQQQKINDLSILSTIQQLNNDQEIFHAQKRAQIIELVKFIINMQQDELNEQIKPLICHFYLELKAIKIIDKGVVSLLNMFGHPEEIVGIMQQQWEQEKEQQEEIMRKSQMMIENEFEDMQIQQNTQQRSTPSKSVKTDDPFVELRKKEMDEEKQFLNQHGVGIKKRIVDLERAKQQTQQNIPPLPNKKKVQAVDQKVLENIASIKLKKEEEILQKQVEEEEKQRRIQMLTKKAQQEIQKRNQSQKQIDKYEGPKIDLIDLDEQEQMDLESVNIIAKQYHKAFKYLFSKYSNSTNQVNKKQYFGELQEQFQVIQYSDIMRMLKDYQVVQSKEDVQGLIKAINQKYSDSKSDTNLDYDNFLKFMIQLSMRTEKVAFQKGTAGLCLEQQMESFAQVAKAKNENYLIFKDPDNINIDPDRDLIHQLNYQLQFEDVQVPSRLKKVTEKQFKFNYKFRNNLLGLNQGWLDCNEIVNQIVFDTFKTNIMEPLSEVKVVTKVKPNLAKDVKEIQQPASKKITNKAIEEKQMKYQEDEQKRLEAEEKRKKHQEKLKQEYLRKKKEKEQEEQIKKEEARQLLIEKGEREKRLQEQLKKEAEEKKNKLREYKEQQAEINKIKEQQQIEITKQKQEIEKRQREEFNKKQKQEVHKMIEETSKAYKSKEEEEKKKLKEQDEQMKEWKNNVENMLKEEQEMRQREKQMQQKIMDLYNEPNVQALFSQYEKPLLAIYHSYQEYTDWKIENAEKEKDLLQLKGFTNFASQFNIYPSIINPDDAQLIFRSLQRERERLQQLQNEKQGFTENAKNGMTFKEFEQALLRIAIKGQKYFDVLQEKYQKSMKTIDMIALKKEKNQDQKGPIDKKEDTYQQVDLSSYKTLQGLLYFLDIPDEKIELQAKLRALKLEYQKIAATKDKKQVLQQKLGEEVKAVRRIQSVNKDYVPEKKDQSKDKTGKQESRLASRNKSINQRQSKSRLKSQKSKSRSASKDKLQSVNSSKLLNQSVQKLEAVGPDGKKEQWQIKNE